MTISFQRCQYTSQISVPLKENAMVTVPKKCPVALGNVLKLTQVSEF